MNLGLSDLGNFGSFLGGLAAIFGLVSIIIAWVQWKHYKIKEEKDRNAESQREKIHNSRELIASIEGDMTYLLAERAKYLNIALKTRKDDRILSSIAMISAIRGDIILTNKISTRLSSIQPGDLSGEQKQNLRDHCDLLRRTVKEDLNTAQYLQNYAVKLANLWEKEGRDSNVEDLSDAQLNRSTFETMDRLKQAAFTFLNTTVEVDRLNGAFERLIDVANRFTDEGKQE